MKKYILFTLLSLFCVSCTKENWDDLTSEEAFQKGMIDRIAYRQDPKTKLCYALCHSPTINSSVMLITNVPCTEEVLKLIK